MRTRRWRFSRHAAWPDTTQLPHRGEGWGERPGLAGNSPLCCLKAHTHKDIPREPRPLTLPSPPSLIEMGERAPSARPLLPVPLVVVALLVLVLHRRPGDLERDFLLRLLAPALVRIR